MLENSKNLFFYTFDISLNLKSLDKVKKHQAISLYGIAGFRGIWFGAIFPYKVNGRKQRYTFGAIFAYMVMAGKKGI